MKLVVVGTGYVGLMTGAGFASLGHDVVCVDTDLAKIDALARGDIPWYEPGLPDLVREGVDQGRLKFTPRLSQAMVGAGLIFISVGPPPSDDGSADLTAVETVANDIGAALITDAVPIDICTLSSSSRASHSRRFLEAPTAL